MFTKLDQTTASPSLHEDSLAFQTWKDLDEDKFYKIYIHTISFIRQKVRTIKNVLNIKLLIDAK